MPRERDPAARADVLAADPLRSGGPAAQSTDGCGFANCADAVAALVRNRVTAMRIHPLRKCTPGLQCEKDVSASECHVPWP
jgi:hypothetical protein